MEKAPLVFCLIECHRGEKTVKLQPLQQDDFEHFVEREIHEYANDHVRNGNWAADDALEKARKEFQSLLPEGLHTKGQYLWSSVDQNNNKVGVLWVPIKDRKAFINDFVVDEEYRGRGFGKQALLAMETELGVMDVESVGLHVFGDNVTAQELYRKMGFETTGIYMRKKLEKLSGSPLKSR